MTTIINADLNKPAPPRFAAEQPGGLRSATSMTIQTRQAQKLVLGRKRGKAIEPIIGLLDFGRRMKLIWLSAERDDPYADWSLLKIETSINAARSLIQEKQRGLADILTDMDSFDIQIANSLEPVVIPIHFQNPYGYMGAYLIADYDALARTVFTARHIGLMDRAGSEKCMNLTGKAIRRTFNLAVQWKFTGVTRCDLAQLNQNAQRAIDAFGECPAGIIDLSMRAKMAPMIKTQSQKIPAPPDQDNDEPATLLVKPDPLIVPESEVSNDRNVLSLAAVKEP